MSSFYLMYQKWKKTQNGWIRRVAGAQGAERISKETKRSTVVTVGVHLENITKDEIDLILKNSKKIIDIFLERIGN